MNSDEPRNVRLTGPAGAMPRMIQAAAKAIIKGHPGTWAEICHLDGRIAYRSSTMARTTRRVLLGQGGFVDRGKLVAVFGQGPWADTFLVADGNGIQGFMPKRDLDFDVLVLA